MNNSPGSTTTTVHSSKANSTTKFFEATGSHLLLTLSGCSPAMLDDQTTLRELCQRAATATGATVLQLVSHRFQPQGVTVLVVLAESHASLHTYPESGVLFWDCFTCGQECKPELSVQVLVDALAPLGVNQRMIQRGK
jgi:S-adenosylmethionine decarboxylase